MTQLQYYTTIGRYLLLTFGFAGLVALVAGLITLVYVFWPYAQDR